MHRFFFAFFAVTYFFCNLALADDGDLKGTWWFQIDNFVNLNELTRVKNYYDNEGHKNLKALGLFSNDNNNRQVYHLAYGSFKTRDRALSFVEKQRQSVDTFVHRSGKIVKGETYKGGIIDLSKYEKNSGTMKNGKESSQVVDLSGLSEEKLLNLQKALKYFGTYKRKIDGVWGKGTKAAVQKIVAEQDWDKVGQTSILRSELDWILDTYETSLVATGSGTPGNADTTGNADTAGNADAAGNADTAGNADAAGNADTAGNADAAGNADTAGNADAAGNADTAGNADAAGNADNEIQKLAEFQKKLDDALQLLESAEKNRAKIDKENEDLSKDRIRLKAQLENYELPFKDQYNYFGIPPETRNLESLEVDFKKYCGYAFDPNLSTIKNQHGFINNDRCVHVVHSEYERLPKSEADINENKKRVVFKLRKTFPKHISSIKLQASELNFDDRNCTFDLEFSHSSSGQGFRVAMIPGEDKDSFTAMENDVKASIATIGLALENFHWEDFEVAARQSNNTETNCIPTDQEFHQIAKEDQSGKFTIARTGALSIKGINLIPNLDDLLVFLSTNIGTTNSNDGIEEYNSDFPFSKDLDLQRFYVERALHALQKYLRKPDIKFKNVKLIKADDASYIEKLNENLPNKSLEINIEALVDSFAGPLKAEMPSVANFLSDSSVPRSTGTLIIGSFGLDEKQICNNLKYKKIFNNREETAIAIINFVPLENTAELNSEKFIKLPPTRNCPDNDKIFLVYPGPTGTDDPNTVSNNLYKVMNKGLER